MPPLSQHASHIILCVILCIILFILFYLIFIFIFFVCVFDVRTPHRPSRKRATSSTSTGRRNTSGPGSKTARDQIYGLKDPANDYYTLPASCRLAALVDVRREKHYIPRERFSGATTLRGDRGVHQVVTASTGLCRRPSPYLGRESCASFTKPTVTKPHCHGKEYILQWAWACAVVISGVVQGAEASG